MADDVEPAPLRAAAVGGRIIEIIGWLVVALAAGMIVLQAATGSVSVAGVVLALFVAIAGGAAVGIGRAVERSRGP